mmetsp:Transcript_26720/g.49031  ORF Transcript_26720/g.49031 Transcript_26720/m.49031 type:complete len:222 (-) Transcript_26720:95-760(-)
MAINPVLAKDDAGNLFPLPKAGETWLLKRDDIDFTCKLPRGGRLTGHGQFFFSTTRIVFVATGKTSRQDFKAFEIPLPLMRDEKFQQPIFGANYLEGQLLGDAIDAQSPLSGGSTQWSLTFRAGGCGTFLPLFYKHLYELRGGADSQDNSIAQAAMQGRLNQVAFVDPSDPSTLFVSQPRPVDNSEERTAFEMEDPATAPEGPRADAEPARNGNNSGCVCS